MKLPTIKQLRYFLALSETGHFGRAAANCFVSQSAFSSAIAELENLLGIQLVDRTNRRVTITATGQDIAVQARLCIRDVESLVELAKAGREPLCGELRLGVIPSIAPFLLPKMLPRLRREYPLLDLYLTEDQTKRIYERLMDGELDVILLGRGFAWLDAGTPQALLQAANFVQAIEDRQGMKIACVEEVAYRMGFIGIEDFKQLAESAPGNGYASYLRRMLEEEAYAIPAGAD